MFNHVITPDHLKKVAEDVLKLMASINDFGKKYGHDDEFVMSWESTLNGIQRMLECCEIPFTTLEVDNSYRSFTLDGVVYTVPASN